MKEEDLSVLAAHCGGEHTVEAVVFDRIRVYNLSYRSHYHVDTSGWPVSPAAWQGIETAVQTGCIRAGLMVGRKIFCFF